MLNFLLGIVINFVLGQIAAASGAIDWAKDKAALIAKVNAIFSGFWAFLDPAADAAVGATIDAIAFALADSADLALIAGDLAAKNWSKALADLEGLLLNVATPHAPTVAAIAALRVTHAA